MKKSGSILIGILLLMVCLMTTAMALSSASLSSSVKIQRQIKQLQALALAEAGLNKGLWEINRGNNTYGTTPTLDTSLEGGEFEVTITSCGTNCKYINSKGYLPTKVASQATREVRVKIVSVQTTSNVSFKYGAITDDFGIYMENNSKIKGSVYANGMIYATNKSAEITGSATSTGKNILQSWIAGGTIDGDAAAYLITGSTVKGNKTTGSYPPTEQMPIADADLASSIQTWEDAAEAGNNIIEGNKVISGTTETLGPVRINGDLIINNNASLKITGTVWVNGNITINNGATVYLDNSYGNSSGVIIADYIQDRTNFNKGRITVNQGAKISGIDPNNPKTPSYIMLFSTQKPRQPWEDFWRLWPAITIYQNALGGVFYAPYGSISLENNAQARAIASSGLYLKQNAIVDYDGGMANSSFANGPAGNWTITEWLILD